MQARTFAGMKGDVTKALPKSNLEETDMRVDLSECPI